MMKAVVLAGGFGTRARPLTANRPKPMLPLGNRPLLEHTVRLLTSHGFNQMVFLLFHQPEQIRQHFGNGSRWGCSITYLQPGQDLGTAGAVAQAREFLRRETFLVASADVATDFDLAEGSGSVRPSRELRHDPLHRRWVIVSSERALRPDGTTADGPRGWSPTSFRLSTATCPCCGARRDHGTRSAAMVTTRWWWKRRNTSGIRRTESRRKLPGCCRPTGGD